MAPDAALSAGVSFQTCAACFGGARHRPALRRRQFLGHIGGAARRAVGETRVVGRPPRAIRNVRLFLQQLLRLGEAQRRTSRRSFGESCGKSMAAVSEPLPEDVASCLSRASDFASAQSMNKLHQGKINIQPAASDAVVTAAAGTGASIAAASAAEADSCARCFSSSVRATRKMNPAMAARQQPAGRPPLRCRSEHPCRLLMLSLREPKPKLLLRERSPLSKCPASRSALQDWQQQQCEADSLRSCACMACPSGRSRCKSDVPPGMHSARQHTFWPAEPALSAPCCSHCSSPGACPFCVFTSCPSLLMGA